MKSLDDPRKGDKIASDDDTTGHLIPGGTVLLPSDDRPTDDVDDTKGHVLSVEDVRPEIL